MSEPTTQGAETGECVECWTCGHWQHHHGGDGCTLMLPDHPDVPLVAENPHLFVDSFMFRTHPLPFPRFLPYQERHGSDR